MGSAPSCHSGSLLASRVPLRFALKSKRNHFLPKHSQVLASYEFTAPLCTLKAQPEEKGAHGQVQVDLPLSHYSPHHSSCSSLLTSTPASRLGPSNPHAQRSSGNSLEHGADDIPLLKGWQGQEQTSASTGRVHRHPVLPKSPTSPLTPHQHGAFYLFTRWSSS